MFLTAVVRASLESHVGKPSSAYGWSGGFFPDSLVFAHLWWTIGCIQVKYSWKGQKTHIKKKKKKPVYLNTSVNYSKMSSFFFQAQEYWDLKAYTTIIFLDFVELKNAHLCEF